MEGLETRCVPASFYVLDYNDSGAGSLRDAITQANASSDASSTITFDCGASGTIQLLSALDALNRNITIIGYSSASNNLVSRSTTATTNFPIFKINSGKTCEFDYLGIGYGTDSGIQNFGTLTLQSCQVTQNSTSTNGGGIYNVGTLSLESTSVDHNTAVLGGGFYNDEGGSVSASYSTITYNTATDSGGGLYNGAGTGAATSVTLTSCDVTYNNATVDGGGIADCSVGSSATVTMNGGSLDHNTAVHQGGGVFINCPKGVVGGIFSNVQITNNQTTGLAVNGSEGGGFRVAGGGVSFDTCTFTNNTSSQVGNAAGAYAGTSNSATYSATNCTFGTSPLQTVLDD